MRLLGALLLCFPCAAIADPWQALKTDGAIAIMRHAIAPGVGDPANFDLQDCSTQRNLDDTGRAQARAIGQAFRDRGLSFDKVLTSQWCRARDTATLLDLGPVIDAPALNSFFEDRSGRDRQTAATHDLLASTKGRLILVTHQVNITALTGHTAGSGEVLVIRPSGDSFQVLGTILIAP